MWRASKIDDLDSLCEVTNGTSLHKTKKNDNNSKISLMPVRYTNGNILQATNGNNKGAIPCKFENSTASYKETLHFINKLSRWKFSYSVLGILMLWNTIYIMRKH